MADSKCLFSPSDTFDHSVAAVGGAVVWAVAVFGLGCVAYGVQSSGELAWNWCKKTRSSKLYEDTKNSKIVTIFGDINAPMFDHVKAALEEAEDKKRSAIDVVIHTNGGSAVDTHCIVQLLTRFKGAVRVWVPSCAISGGTAIALCLLKQARFIAAQKNTLFSPIDSIANGVPLLPLEQSIASAKELVDPVNTLDSEFALTTLNRRCEELIKANCLPAIDEEKHPEFLKLVVGGRQNHHTKRRYNEEEMNTLGVPLKVFDNFPPEILALRESWTVSTSMSA